MFFFPFWDPPKYPVPHDCSVAWTRVMACLTAQFMFLFPMCLRPATLQAEVPPIFLERSARGRDLCSQGRAQLPLRQKKSARGLKAET